MNTTSLEKSTAPRVCDWITHTQYTYRPLLKYSHTFLFNVIALLCGIKTDRIQKGWTVHV